MWFLLILIAIPFVEIALFIQIGGLLGLWPTLGLVVLSAVVGLAIVRAQGVNAIGRLQASVAAGGDLAGPIADAALILVAGLLLLIPGFFTDLVALVLLVPAARLALMRLGAGRVPAQSVVFRRGPLAPRRPQDTIEGDYEVLDDVPPSQRGASGWTRGRP